MGNMSGSSGSHYTLWQSITQNSQDIANNKSNVTVRMYLTFDGSSWYAYTNYATSGSMTINGITHNYSIASINFSSGQSKDLLLAEWTGDIDHDPTTGEKVLNVSGSWNTDTSKIGSGSCSASLSLTTIPRYSEINSFSIQSMGLNTAVIQYSVSRTANIYCSVDGMAWGNPIVEHTTFGTFIISGLSPNTQHSFAILVRTVDNGLDRISDTIYGNTLNIGTVTFAPDINFGDTATIIKNNPSGARNDLRIETLSPTTTIAIRTQISDNYNLTLTDDEWDTLYKMLGNSNSITIRYVIDTIDGGNIYYHWLDRTLTLKGNQKTIRKKVSNEWTRGKLWTNVNGTWKRAVLWTNVSGTWKRGI